MWTKVLISQNLQVLHNSNLDESFSINDRPSFLYLKGRHVKYNVYSLLNMRWPRSEIENGGK